MHIQDNLKLSGAEGDDGEGQVIVHEDVVNTYRQWDGYDAAPGDAYWADTQAYWAGVRHLWDEVIARDGGIRVLHDPRHPYTRMLIDCHPDRTDSLVGIPGTVPSPVRP